MDNPYQDRIFRRFMLGKLALLDNILPTFITVPLAMALAYISKAPVQNSGRTMLLASKHTGKVEEITFDGTTFWMYFTPAAEYWNDAECAKLEKIARESASKHNQWPKGKKPRTEIRLAAVKIIPEG